MNEITERVIKILVEILECEEEQLKSQEEKDLTDMGLDSIKAIELVVNLESEYEIMIDEDDLLLENLNTINKIVQVVAKYQEAIA